MKLINKLSNDFYKIFEVRKLTFKDLDEVSGLVIRYYSLHEPLGQIFES